jgi:predicted SAM-dependent methyltransferase
METQTRGGHVSETTTSTTIRRLEVGSGTRPTPGYEHADVNPNLPELDYVCAMHELRQADGTPIPDNTYDDLKATHVPEHAPIRIAMLALREWLRVLKPGGRAHLDTPNIERNARLYLNGGWERDFERLTLEEQERCSLNGVPNKTLWFNFKTFSSDAQHDIHYWNADADLLTALCLDAGFSSAEVVQTEPSLIVHAIK